MGHMCWTLKWCLSKSKLGRTSRTNKVLGGKRTHGLRTQRGNTVHPQNEKPSTKLCTIEQESDAGQTENAEVGTARTEANEDNEADDWKEHVEDLTRRVAQHFEDEHDGAAVGPPIIKTQVQHTNIEWEMHQDYSHALQTVVSTSRGRTSNEMQSPEERTCNSHSA